MLKFDDWVDALRRRRIGGAEEIRQEVDGWPEPAGRRAAAVWLSHLREQPSMPGHPTDQLLIAADEALDDVQREAFQSYLHSFYGDDDRVELARRLIAERLGTPWLSHPNPFQSCVFPIALLEEHGYHGYLFELHAQTLGTLGGRVVIAPGLVRVGVHSWINRTLDASGETLAAFDRSALAAASASGQKLSELPDVEVWWEAVHGAEAEVATLPLSGNSVGLAAYATLRSLWSKEPFDGRATLLSAQIVASQDGFEIGEIGEGEAKDTALRDACWAALRSRGLGINLAIIQSPGIPRNTRPSPNHACRVESLSTAWEHVQSSRKAVEIYVHALIAYADRVGDINGKRLSDFTRIPIRVGVKSYDGELLDPLADDSGTYPESSRYRDGDGFGGISSASRSDPGQSDRILPTDLFLWARGRSEGVRMVVSGPGMGKTVAAKALATRYAEDWVRQETSPVPILVDLRHYQVRDSGSALEGLISAAVNSALERSLIGREEIVKRCEATLKSLIRQGKAIVIADGLDQFPRRASKLDELREIFNEIACARSESDPLSGCPVIVTARRSSETDLDLAERDRVELIGFDKRSAEFYVAAALGTASGQPLQKLLTKSNLGVGLSSPKILSIACFLAAKGLLPDVKGEVSAGMLYHSMMSLIFKGGAREWMRVADFMLFLWQKAAITGGISEEEFLLMARKAERASVGGGFLDQEAERLYDVLRDAGITEAVVRDGREYLVSTHRTLWEFLAGYALARSIEVRGWDHWRGFVDEAAWMPEFEEILVFAADVLVNVLPDGLKNVWLLELVLYTLLGDTDLVGRRSALVWRCLAICPHALVTDSMRQIARELVDRYIVEITLGAEAMNVGEVAFSPLSVIENTTQTRWASGTEATGWILLESLGNLTADSDPDVRREGAIALGHIARANPALSDRARHLLESQFGDRDGRVRAAAANSLVWSIEELEPTLWLPMLNSISEKAEKGNPLERETTARVLGRLAGRGSECQHFVFGVLSEMAGDAELRVRLAAIRAMGQLVRTEPKQAPAVFEDVAKRWETSEAGERVALAEVLAAIVEAGDPTVSDLAFNILLQGLASCSRVGDVAALCVGRIAQSQPGGASWLREHIERWALQGTPSPGTPDLRRIAADCIGSFVVADPKMYSWALRLLTILARNEEHRVRLAAALSLRSLVRVDVDWPSADLGLLATMVQDPAEDVRAQVAWFLGHLGRHSSSHRTEILFHLSTLARDSGVSVREAAVTSIGQLIRVDGEFGDRAMDLLTTAAEDPIVAVTARAAWSLGELAQANPAYLDDVVRALSKMVQGQADWCKRAAAESLCRIASIDVKSGSRIHDLFEEMLSDPLPGSVGHWYGVRALGALAEALPVDSAQILRRLSTALHSNDVLVRRAAVSALGRVAIAVPSQAISACRLLLPHVNDSERYVRTAATDALCKATLAFLSISNRDAAALNSVWVVSLSCFSSGSLGRVGAKEPKHGSLTCGMDIGSAHRFWNRLYAGSSKVAVRAFSEPAPKVPDSSSLYVRTIEELTSRAVLPSHI